MATGSVTAKTGYFRLSFLTVAVTALVLALSGCGSSSQGGPTSPSASTTAATSATLAGSRASATTKTSTGAAASTATSAGAGDHACGNRKQRITPLTKGALAVLHAWLAERGGQPGAPLFPTSTGTPLTRKALARRIAKHAVAAGEQCPSLNVKTITPHVLRHTAAMRLLHADVDTTVIALWLGHEQFETTQMHLHTDLAIKERALARIKPLDSKPGRYRPPDTLVRFLDGL